MGVAQMTAEPDGREESDDEGRDKPTEARQTVSVSKSLAILAKKNAVFRGQKLNAYIKPILTECIQRIEKEILDLGPLAVRDRAEKAGEAASPIGTLNTTPDIATRLTSLAGQCLTSVAKIIHPHLKQLVELHAIEEWMNRTVIEVKPDGTPFPPQVRDALSIDFIAKSHGLVAITLEDESLAEHNVHKGDVIFISHKDAIELGDTVVVLENGKPSLWAVRQPNNKRRPAAAKRLPPPIALEEARRTAYGKVTMCLNFPRPALD